MMDVLHKIREEHHEKIKGKPLAEQVCRFPDRCKHCGHGLPPMTRSAGVPLAGDSYTVIEMKTCDGETQVRIESPRCGKCGERTVFDLVV